MGSDETAVDLGIDSRMDAGDEMSSVDLGKDSGVDGGVDADVDDQRNRSPRFNMAIWK